MTLLFKAMFLTAALFVCSNLTFAADSDTFPSSQKNADISNFQTSKQNLDISTLFASKKNQKLFLKTGNLLDIKGLHDAKGNNVLYDPDNLLNEPSVNAINFGKNQRKQDNFSRLLNKRRISESMQVRPGTENPNISINSSEGRVVCDNQNMTNCNEVGLDEYSKIDSLGKKIVNYSLAGFQSVGILVTYKSNETTVCNFVIISLTKILTAKHCVIEDPSAQRAWLLMRSDNISNPSFPLMFDGCKSEYVLGEGGCTFHKLTVTKNKENRLWEDNADVAMLDLDPSSLPNDKEFPRETIPKLDFSDSKYGILTLVGNGNSNIKDYGHRRPLVGWFAGVTTDTLVKTYLEPSLIDTKPAKGDSGSPVFNGEYFGRICDSKECSPYLLTAIVTGGSSKDNKPIANIQDVSSNKTNIVRLSKYKNFICNSDKDILGC